MSDVELNSSSQLAFGKEQNHVITIVRVMAMWMIIGCHVSSWLAIPFLAMALNVGVYVFLLISGMLYAKKPIPDGIRFVKRRWLKICIPMYYLTAFLLVLNIFTTNNGIIEAIPIYLLNLQGIEFIVSGLHPCQINGLGHLWFLTVIMLCYFLLIPVKKIEKKLSNRPVLISFIFLILFAADILAVYTIKVQLSYFIVFFLGYIIGCCTEEIKNRAYLLYTISMFFAIIIRLLCRFYADGTIIYNDLVVPFAHTVLAIWIYKTVRFVAQKVSRIVNVCAKSNLVVWMEKGSLYFYMTHYMFLVGPLYVNRLPFSIIVQLMVFLGVTFLSGIILQYISEKTVCRIIS